MMKGERSGQLMGTATTTPPTMALVLLLSIKPLDLGWPVNSLSMEK